MSFPIGFLDGLSPGMLIFLGVVAVLLFGERLPEVARSLGKQFTVFRKSVQTIQDEVRSAAFSVTSELSSVVESHASSVSSTSSSNGSARTRKSDEDYDEATAPKFVPPPAEEAVS